jgi:PASTA domain
VSTRADERAVGPRIAAAIPRLVVIAAAGLFASATITFAAGTALGPKSSQRPRLAGSRHLLVVPDVRRQVFVFAKGMLEDEGFGWRVEGSVRGYPSNIVVSQSPAPRTRVVDTGAPGVTLELARNSRYAQAGNPEDRSPFGASVIRTVERSSSKHRAKPARVKRVTKAHRKSR